MSRTSLTSAQKKQIVALRKEGNSPKILAERFNVDQSTIYRVVKDAGGSVFKRLTHEQKVTMVALKDQGASANDLAVKFHVNVTTVHRTIKDADQYRLGSKPVQNPNLGRPRIIKERTENILRRQLRINPFLTAAELREMNKPFLGKASIRTIQDNLARHMGLPCRRAAKKPLLTPRMKKQRYRWALKHRSWKPDKWRKVMWSDESTFRCLTPRRGLVRRSKATSRFYPGYQLQTLKHPQSQMVWGCFSGKSGLVKLEFLEKGTTMTAVRYLRILKRNLPGCMRGHRYFMHDHASVHTAHKVTRWFQGKKYTLVTWPGNSPDLNPIENLWSIIKKKVFREGKNLSLPVLQATIRHVWDREIPRTHILNLVDSMPRRIRNVIDAKGAMTKY